MSRIALVLLLQTGAVSAQAPVSTDIWLGQLNWVNEKVVIEGLRKLTDLPRYTNQPYFFDEKTLYFTQSVMMNGVDQTDIFRLDVATLQIQNLTNSQDSEYSPTPMPNNQGLSVIKVNDSGKQELWQLNWEGNTVAHLLPGIEPIGYQVWVDDNHLMLFVLGEPHMLVKADIRDASDSSGAVVDTNIGPSLWRIPDSDFFSYTVEELTAEETRWRLKFQHAKYNLASGVKSILLPKAGYYYAWTPQGHILTTREGELVVNDVKTDSGFELVAGSCNTTVSRIAVSKGGKVALVCEQ